MENENLIIKQSDAATSTAVQQPATEQAGDDPDSRRVKIRRVESETGPATCIPYEDGSGEIKHWFPNAVDQKFEVAAMIAVAAIATGLFEESPDTKTRLRAGKSQ